MMNTIRCKLSEIRLDGGTQPRVALNEEVVSDYAQALLAGDELPPVSVMWDGVSRWLFDGFHRYHAAVAAGSAEIECEQQNGTRRDAILAAVGANARHGLRLTNEDKRRAIRMLLDDEEWAAWSDRKIAQATNSTHPTVSRLRAEAAGRVVNFTTQQQQEAAAPPAGKAPKRPEEKAPEPARPAADVPAPASGEEPDDAPSLEELLQELQRENEALRAELKAAESDDKTAEVLKWKRIADAAIRGQDEATERAASAGKREAWAARQLARCGKAVGEENPENIAAKVEAMARSVRGR